MGAREIDVPNPPALPSNLPEHVLELAVQIEKRPLEEDVKKGLVDFQRAACYIAAGMYSVSSAELMYCSQAADTSQP
jgi:xylulose-5-phosphate/fructose-6-phosphate phosphoketolase